MLFDDCLIWRAVCGLLLFLILECVPMSPNYAFGVLSIKAVCFHGLNGFKFVGFGSSGFRGASFVGWV